MASGRFPVLRDIAERVFNTAWQTAAAVLTADGINLVDLRDLSFWKGAGVAALGAAFALVKTIVASRIGRTGSASLDPAVELQPTGAAVS